MEVNGKPKKDGTKLLFAGRLDALLARGKPRPTTSRFYLVNSSNSEVSNQMRFAPTSLENSTHSSANPANLATIKPRVNSSGEANRRLLIREMLERTKVSRRLTSTVSAENASVCNDFGQLSSNGNVSKQAVIQSIVVRPPRPPRPVMRQKPIELTQSSLPSSSNMADYAAMLPSNENRQIIGQSTSTFSSSNPTLPEITNSGSASLLESIPPTAEFVTNHEQLSVSMPELSPPNSPDLMDFPSDSESEDDGPVQLSEIPTAESAESIFEAFDALFINRTDQSSVLEEPVPAATFDGVLIDTTESESVAETNSSTSEINSTITASASNTSLYENGNQEFSSGLTSLANGVSTQTQLDAEISNLSRASSSSSGISSVSYDSTPGGLKMCDKVVWFTENGVPETGEVKWVGKINDRFHAGVQFDNPVGNSSGKLNGKRLFISALTHGRFVPVSELMFHEDYYQGYCGSNEPSSCPHGFPDLRNDSDGDSMPFVCVICQDDLLTLDENGTDKESTKEMLTTKCGHLFHSDCLNKWFSLKKKLQQPCPYCQRVMDISNTIRIFPVQGKR